MYIHTYLLSNVQGMYIFTNWKPQESLTLDISAALRLQSIDIYYNIYNN